MRRLFLASAAVAAALGAGCSGPPKDPIQLERTLLTVENQSKQDWSDVQIWLNTYFRVTTPSIPAGGRFQTTLGSFVDGFGRRFEFQRMQVTDLRVTARLPDGRPVEIKKAFRASGLPGVLGGKR
ncbi:MAG: hypothetical protein ACM3SQ_01185 [Betaproteobacteria bacterium]